MTIKRRIFVVILAVVLLMSCSIPVSAAEVEIPVDYIDLTDYYTIPFRSLTNGTHVITYDLPRNDIYYAVDMLIQAPYGLNAVSFVHPSIGDYPLNFVSIGNGYHRVYGGIPMNASPTITLKYTVNSPYGTDNLQIVSFKVSYTSGYSFATSIYGQVGNVSESPVNFYWNSNTDYDVAYFGGSEDAVDRPFNAYLWVNDWRKFDYLDIQLYLSVAELTSLSASIAGSFADSVPISLSYVNSLTTSDYLVHILVDLTSVQRWTSDPFEIVLTGNAGWLKSQLTSIGVLSCSGYLDSSPNPLFYYFKILTNNLSNMFAQLSSWIQAQTTAIGGFISDLEDTLVSRFRSLNNSIDEWGQAIVDAISGDSSAAEEFQEQIDNSNQQLKDMTAVMDSFTTPDINSMNVDVGSFVTPSDLNSLSAPMSMLFESNIVVTCIMIALILGTVMFVLYGKR